MSAPEPQGAGPVRPGPPVPPQHWTPPHDGPPQGPAPTSRAPEMPEDVRTARLLWWAAAGFALLGAVISALVVDLSDLPPQTLDSLRDMLAGVDGGPSLEAVWTAQRVLGIVMALVLAGLTIWLAAKMATAKRWARLVLDLGGVLLVVDALGQVVPTVLGSLGGGSALPGAQSGSMAVFLGMCGAILAGLCAGVAMWRQHTRESEGYFAGDDNGRSR